MNADPWLWSALLLAFTLGLLALPFYPAWSEWRRPRDIEPAVLDNGPRSPPTPLVVRKLRIAPGASFGQLQSDRLVLGAGPLPSCPPLPRLTRWQPPEGARPWGKQGWHVGHPLDIAAHQLVPCSLVVRGRLNVQGPCLMEGDVKARDNLRLGPGTRVLGNLFGAGDIWLSRGCTVRGLVMAEGRLHLEPGVVIGAPEHPVSVCADVIEAHGPVLVHGSVQARIRGTVCCDAPQTPSSSTPKDSP